MFPAGALNVACQSDAEFPQVVCGAVLFHSPVNRARFPNCRNPF